MDNEVIDLRSDTVSRPTSAMRQAIANAVVGDDVLADDPTVTALERELADRLGKAAAIFMPSGTMANQVAIRLHCRPGDEFLCERACHIYNYEQGAFAQLSGVVAQPVPGERGMLSIDVLDPLVRADNEHLVRTRMVCLENTHNFSGGSVLPFDAVVDLSQWAERRGLCRHLDGARLFNAVVASGIDVARWASLFDTVSVCFSKGLGAPIGSALVGDAELIHAARRHRKVLGGGMRQVGIIAAGALFALQHHVERLVTDHEHARQLATCVQGSHGLSLVNDPVETNMVFLDLDESLGNAHDFVSCLKRLGVLVLAENRTRIRAVTHLDVSPAQIDRAVKVIQRAAADVAQSLA